MKFSIITIVLNDKYNIKNTICSILNQKIEHLEYIIIDGGSTDGTLDIIKQYEDKIDILISEKDDGIVDAFNKGIHLASGDIIGIINSGDWLVENMLQSVVSTYENNSCDIVYGDVQYWQGEKKEYLYTANHNYLESFMSMNHPSVFVKKFVYERYGDFDKKYSVAMDYELMLRFYKNNLKFHYINKVISNMSLGGVSDISWRKAYLESYKIRKKHLGFSFTLYFLYCMQIVKRYISNFLSKVGLEKLKKIYRNRFSIIKKRK